MGLCMYYRSSQLAGFLFVSLDLSHSAYSSPASALLSGGRLFENNLEWSLSLNDFTVQTPFWTCGYIFIYFDFESLLAQLCSEVKLNGHCCRCPDSGAVGAGLTILDLLSPVCILTNGWPISFWYTFPTIPRGSKGYSSVWGCVNRVCFSNQCVEFSGVFDFSAVVW